MNHMEIAKTILEQMGGNRFTVMTGAKNMSAVKNGLQFALPGTPGYVKSGINRVIIRLKNDDTYTMEFGKYRPRKMEYNVIETVDGVYCDQLQDIFLRVTGLATRF